MAIDAALLWSVSRGGQPTVRIYSWDAPCVSLGRLQPADDLLDWVLCANRGAPVVRRPTGGRALLHHPGEVTYSVAAPEGEPPIGGDILASYRSINNALLQGLALLGVRATVRERPPRWPDTGVGFGCFEAAYRHEVYWAGRKIVASAQRRRGGGFLQQGTIPGSKTGEDLASLLRLGPAQRVVLTRDLGERTGTLERALDRLPSLAEAAAALAEGFRRAWGASLIQGDLTPDERAMAIELERGHNASPRSVLDPPDPASRS